MTFMTYILLSKCLRSSDSSIAISCIISSASFMPVNEREQPWDNLNQRYNSKQVNKSTELACKVTHFHKIFYSNFVFSRKYPSTHPFSVFSIFTYPTDSHWMLNIWEWTFNTSLHLQLQLCPCQVSPSPCAELPE